MWKDEFADLCRGCGGCRWREVNRALDFYESQARGRVEELRKGILGAWGCCGGAREMDRHRRHREELIGVQVELEGAL